MMIKRRTFLKTVGAAGAIGLIRPAGVKGGSKRPESHGFFSVHPFIEAHPEAVFVMRTNVDVKTNSKGNKDAGRTFSKSVFVPVKEKGIPLSHMITVKPNITNSSPYDEKYTLEYGMGIITDPHFVEGVIEGMKGLGLSGSQFYIREVTTPNFFEPRGYTGAAKRTGADIRDLARPVGMISENDLKWVDIPGGKAHRKIPYLWPINAKDTFYLNIATFKAHGMGLTLCCKNIQGSIAHNYQDFCHGFSGLMQKKAEHLNPNARKDIEEEYRRHVADRIPRWDRPDPNGGLRMEIWAQRTLDNMSVSPIGLNIIEGIYGRDGNGFLAGPNGPEENEAWDYMTNVIIFGKNTVLVDIIGHWLGGHEPGNIGLFHMAMERGFSKVLDPGKIPVYLWENGTATLIPLKHFERTALKTYYLPRDYNGQNESYYHLVDEYFDYSRIKQEPYKGPDTAYMKVLYESLPGSKNPFFEIEYGVPRTDYARMDILNMEGKQVASLMNSFRIKGAHLAVWNTQKYAPGNYQVRFRTGDFTATRDLVLKK